MGQAPGKLISAHSGSFRSNITKADSVLFAGEDSSFPANSTLHCVAAFALFQISILDLAWDILDVEGAPILGPALKSCFIYVGDFCHRFGKFDSNFPATTDRIDNLKIEPHFKVVRRSLLNKLCDCALL